jgi:hypothetical protein
VVVENAKCDGAFLRIVALRIGEKHLKRRLGDEAFERLQQQWTNPLGANDWITVRHGAGNNTAQQVELATDAEPRAARRLFVLVDSDRDRSDAPIGPTAAQVKKTCERLWQQHGPALRLTLWILRKREVENYLPRDILRAHRSAALESWDLLSDHDKDHVDLKLPQLFGDKLWQVMLEPKHQPLLHERALRERAGRSGGDLDEIVHRLIDLL